MRELNPIVRNAVADILHAIKHQADEPAARMLVEFTAQCVPDYWERPELTESYLELDWSSECNGHDEP